MKLLKSVLSVFSIGVLFLFMFLLIQCERDIFTLDDPSLQSIKDMAAPSDEGETAGNNLSFPVIWSDYVPKTVPGLAIGVEKLDGEWWYVWGEDPIDPAAAEDGIPSCKPDPDNQDLCDDGVDGTATGDTPGDGSTVYKAYVQKDAQNTWQAYNANPIDVVNVDWIDWGDNLESLDWSMKSQVRAEVVLFKDLVEPVTEFAMRHVDSWGIDEVHGLQTDLNGEPIEGLGTKATVYSHNARFTIQKLNVESLDELGDGLTWVPGNGWTDDTSLVNEPIFNMVVYEAGDGPGFYNAEINVKGKIIYGYTWNVRELNEEAGYYRLTFSFDADSSYPLNTYFDQATQIVVPIEEEEETALFTKEDGTGGGGTAVIDVGNNLTYMDINIVAKTSGGGGGNGGGGNGGGGNSGGNGSGTGGGQGHKN